MGAISQFDMEKNQAVSNSRALYECCREQPSLVSVQSGMSNLASKLRQIGPKWDKSGTF